MMPFKLDKLTLDIYKKSSTLKFLPEVIALTAPLKKINIPFFSYIEVDVTKQPNIGLKFLVNDDDFAKYFIKNDGLNIELPYGQSMKTGIYPRTAFPIRNKNVEKYFIDRAAINRTVDELAFTYVQEGKQKTYCFGISSFVGVKVELLEAYIHYFNDKAKNLLEKSDLLLLSPLPKKIIPVPAYSYNDQLSEFLQDINYQEYRLYKIASKYHLSKRELQCLDLIMQNKITKQIAYILGLKQRTIEIYLEHLKLKLNCRTKLELILKVLDLW